MDIEPSQSAGIFGPLTTETLLSDAPLFGSDGAKVDSLIEQAVATKPSAHDFAAWEEITEVFVPDTSAAKSSASVAEKLEALRIALDELSLAERGGTESQTTARNGDEPPSQWELHEKLLIEANQYPNFSRHAQAVMDHAMLLRAKEMYLFNSRKNQQIVADDLWLRDVWAWVAGGLLPTRPISVPTPLSCY
jgi:WD repeat-containing protein mio